MFGDTVTTEITSNLLQTPGYPPFLSYIISIFIAIIPLTKVPLAARPIISTLELLCGVPSPSQPQTSPSFLTTLLPTLIRIITTILLVLISILFPAFDSIMAFMGSSLCFTICIILPILFYLKIFGQEVSRKERVLDYVLIGVCSVLAVVGTVWAFLPRAWIGIE